MLRLQADPLKYKKIWRNNMPVLIKLQNDSLPEFCGLRMSSAE